ncbi:MAG: TIGR03557 family F420-dependent LLM class oxidoreductase, partial [Chloroflexi bacterium]
WPAFEQRLDMLEESVEVIRMLWEGETATYYGLYYTVENARIYTLPEILPLIMVAASGPTAAELAGSIGDGFISTSPEKELVDAFAAGGDANRPKYGQFTVCCDENTARARQIAHKWWPTAALHGQLGQELPMPALFEHAVKNVSEDDVAEVIVCGNDPDEHRDMIQKYIDAGFNHVYVHQVGPDQEAFFRFYEREILPHYNQEMVGK